LLKNNEIALCFNTCIIELINESKISELIQLKASDWLQEAQKSLVLL